MNYPKPRLAADALSTVPGFEGPAVAVWLNRSKIDNLMDNGVTGFFRNVIKRGGLFWEYGEEFHGIVQAGPGQTGKIISSTAICAES